MPRAAAPTTDLSLIPPATASTKEESQMQRSIVLQDARRFDDADHETHALLRCLREALAGCDPIRAARIARSRTTVRFAIAGPERESVSGPVLVCDRPHPAVRVDDGPTEVVIHLTPEQARRYRGGTLQLATALVAGAVRATGPARKFLVVEPIVRALIAARAADGGDA